MTELAPLVIIMFRKKDGGISVGAKNVPQSERFFDNHIHTNYNFSSRFARLLYGNAAFVSKYGYLMMAFDN
ncbi:MAG: hypothetical protein PVG17_18365 [Desulfobacterales bacterium]